LSRSPACFLCGRSARDGARMNVDHIKPLSKRWDLRLDPRNLQTACASRNWGKGGR
jgi:5-methylcytosine-specific restriction endonuclease McrA